jgi:hypothetical protein
MTNQPNTKPEKSFTIIVNAEEHNWPQHEITFEQVIELGFPGKPQTDTLTYSVMYRKGEDRKDGILSAGQPPVKVKDGMIFDVTPTDRS